MRGETPRGAGNTTIAIEMRLHEEPSDELSGSEERSDNVFIIFQLIAPLLVYAISTTNTFGSLATPRYARRSFHQTLLKAEQNFPMFVSGKRLHFGKVIAAFERGVMPTITLDIGGAKDMLQPLELMSDMVVKKQKELQKKLEEEKKKKEKEIGHLERGGSYAERARATQRAKLGIEVRKCCNAMLQLGAKRRSGSTM